MNPTLRPDPPATATCAWCGAAFEIPQRPGPTPRYCKASHRQRAHEARQAATLTRPHDLATLAAAHHDTTTAVHDGTRPDWKHAFLTLADAVATTITTTPTPPQPARHPTQPRPPRPPKPGRSAPADTVYECPSCEQRYLGERRCGDCNTFCRRIGPGGLCPHCDAPVAQQDLANH